MGAVRLAAYAGRIWWDAASPTGGNMSRDVEFKHVLVSGVCGGQSRRS